MNTIKLMIFSALTLALSVSAEELPGAKTFKSLDTDGDGFISIIEATGQNDLLRNWVNIDTDANGLVEMSEFSAFESEQPIELVDPAVESSPPEGTQ